MRTLFILLLLAGWVGAEPLKLEQVQQLGKLRLGLKESQVSGLGKVASSSKPVVEGATGLTVQTRTYPAQGLTITWSREKAGDPWVVDRFSAAAPNKWKTPQGIGLGSQAEQVRQTYGALLDAEACGPEQLVVGSIYGGVMFTLKQGKVIRIFVGAAAE